MRYQQPRVERARDWRQAVSLVLTLLAVGLPVATRLLLGPPGAIVHVRWQSAFDEATRSNLERQFRLTEGDRLDERTWRYELIDVSSGNIRAIVGHPAVEDTHHIDRRNYSVASSATRTARQPRFPVDSDTAVRVVDALSMSLATIAAFLFARVIARSAVARPAMQRLTHSVRPLSGFAAGVVQFLSRGIPETTATAVGVFRIVFGAALVWFFVSRPENAGSLDAKFNPVIEGELHVMVLQWMRAHPYVADALTPWLLITGVAFTVGLYTRLTYFLFVVGVVGWLFVATTHDSTHPHSTLGLTLVALLASRWGDALSIDAWRRRGNRLDARAAGKRYGYSVWVPGLVFGVAFASAAWAKLSRHPGWADWILNGSVKYHFITDAHNAPVDWGLQLAGYPSIAVLASLAAVAVEMLVITAAFSRNEWYRLSMGAAASGLLGGFWLFMGVFWPGWWILFLGFLPWRRLSRSFTAASASSRSAAVDLPTWAQIAMIVALVGQQITFSTLRIERSPMFTYYPMYSSTYANSDAFNAAVVPYYRIVVFTDRGNVELSCDAPENLVEEFRAAVQGSTDAAARVWGAVRGCSRDIGTARHVTLEGDRHTFDWDRLMFRTTRAAVVLGPVAANAPLAGSERD